MLFLFFIFDRISIIQYVFVFIIRDGQILTESSLKEKLYKGTWRESIKYLLYTYSMYEFGSHSVPKIRSRN